MICMCTQRWKMLICIIYLFKGAHVYYAQYECVKCVRAYMCVCVQAWGPQVDVGSLFLPLPTLFFEVGYFTEPRAQCLCCNSLPESTSGSTCLLLPTVLGLQVYCSLSGLYMVTCVLMITPQVLKLLSDLPGPVTFFLFDKASKGVTDSYSR